MPRLEVPRLADRAGHEARGLGDLRQVDGQGEAARRARVEDLPRAHVTPDGPPEAQVALGAARAGDERLLLAGQEEAERRRRQAEASSES